MIYRYIAKRAFHSNYLGQDIKEKQMVETKTPIPDTELPLFYPIEERSEPDPPVDRKKLEKEAIKRKLLKPEETSGLSTDQLVQILSAPKKTVEQLLKNAVDKELGTVDELEKLTEDQLSALITGSK
jgi:hypothetical protein